MTEPLPVFGSHRQAETRFAPPKRGPSLLVEMGTNELNSFGNGLGASSSAEPQSALNGEMQLLNDMIARKKAEAEKLPLASDRRKELTKEIGILKGKLTGVKINIDFRTETASRSKSPVLNTKLEEALCRGGEVSGGEAQRLRDKVAKLEAEKRNLENELEQRPARRFTIDDPLEDTSQDLPTRSSFPAQEEDWIFQEHYDTVSENETDKPPKTMRGKKHESRRNAVSVEVYGRWNQRKPGVTHKVYEKSLHHRRMVREALQRCPLFQRLDNNELKTVVDAMEIVEFEAGHKIMTQGSYCDDAEELYRAPLYVVLGGAIDCFYEAPGQKGGYSQARGSKVQQYDPRGKLVTSRFRGSVIGELSILWNTPRALSAYARLGGKTCVARLTREVYHDIVVPGEMRKRQARTELLRSVRLLETMTDEQLAKLSVVLQHRIYDAGSHIIRQGEDGWEFYIIQSGECVAQVQTGEDIQEHRRYVTGDLFGELALLTDQKRGASVVALTRVECLCLSRSKFERLFGPLSQMQQNKYLSDPRRVIADFYHKGDDSGPDGTLQLSGKKPNRNAPTSSWFAVYRPTSRDAMAKMLAQVAVGKGLNIKGKSAKKGLLSGFIPFLQISQNDHKALVEPSPKEGRIKIFFKAKEARSLAQKELEAVLEPGQAVKPERLNPNRQPSGAELKRQATLVMTDPHLYLIDSHSEVFGLDVPEPLVRELYIIRPDITPLVGWETGRASEPAFMDMNLHALRGDSTPEVVLFQQDTADPLNPWGLLLAYAEKHVKPVVSDFDTFLVGSKNMAYEQLAEDQAKLAMWALDHTADLLATPNDTQWTSRWLDILKKENEKGFHPDLPYYGFGDATSYRLIDHIVQSTISYGAVRHGAECFNFYFPQELDDEYLVVWDDNGVKDDWEYMSEQKMREFLLKRVADGYSFPLNPVWPVRDPGWYEVLEALLRSKASKGPIDSWYPPTSGLVQKMKDLHQRFPNGFTLMPEPQEPVLEELDCCERQEKALYEVQSHWRKLHMAHQKMHALHAFSHHGRESIHRSNTWSGESVVKGALGNQNSMGVAACLGPITGEVDPTCATVWAKAVSNGQLVFELISSEGKTHKLIQVADPDKDFSCKARFSGLQPSMSYTIKVGGRSGSFRTPPLEKDSVALSFTFGSCLAGQGYGRDEKHGFKIFTAMAAKKSDFFLLLGDSIYADDKIEQVSTNVASKGVRNVAPSPEAGAPCTDLNGFRARYRYHLEDETYGKFLASHPIWNTWDDHEIVDDWGGPKLQRDNPKLLEAGMRSFFEHWPVGIPVLKKDPQRLYRSFSWGAQADFFVLDVRQYRQPHMVHKDGETPQMSSILGDKQVEWLTDGLLSSRATWKFILNSVPLSWPTGWPHPEITGYDGWADGRNSEGIDDDSDPDTAEHEFKKILRRLWRARICNMVFLSGDTHFPWCIKYDPFQGGKPWFFEFGSTPLCALPLPPAPKPDPSLRPDVLFKDGAFGKPEYMNFGHVSVSAEGKLRFAICQPNGEERYSLELEPQKNT